MAVRKKLSLVFCVVIISSLILFGCGTPEEFTLVINSEGNGAVTTDPQQETYKKGTGVELTAVADANWCFDQWKGSITGSENPVTVVMDSDKNIIATFVKVNQQPVLASIGNKSVVKGNLLSFTVSATDPDGDTLTYSASGELSEHFDPTTRTFSWTPVASDPDSYSMTFTVSDGSLSASETITIMVEESNQAPEFEPLNDQVINVGSTLNCTVMATDANQDVLTYSAVVPTGASFDPETQIFSWTPTSSNVGTHQAIFTVTDGELTDSATITITVMEVNHAPELYPINDISVHAGVEVKLNIWATDIDQDILTYSVTMPSGASFNPGTLQFSWTPTIADMGSHQVIFSVSDGELTDSETVTITVTDVNHAPILEPVGDKTVFLGTTLSFTISASDPDNDQFSIAIGTPPAGYTMDWTTNTFSWTPTADDLGIHQVSFTVGDGNLSDTEIILITVTNEILVPDHFPTIQGAIEHAANGNIITVAQGIYYENLNFLGKAITVRSTAPALTEVRNTTIIDGQQLKPVVTFENDESRDSVLTGFTLQNGLEDYDPSGGGIAIFRASPTISYNKIINNTGSGIMAYSSEVLITDNIIQNNQSARGAGIHIVRESNASIYNNFVLYNTATEFGGGLCIDSSSSGIVQNNSFSNNDATTVGGGIAVIYTSCATLLGNFIDGNTSVRGGGLGSTDSEIYAKGNYLATNTASMHGGGMYISGGTVQNLIDNTIENNSSTQDGAGAVLVSTTGSFDLNKVLTNNSGNDGGGLRTENAIFTITNNTFDGNTALRKAAGVFLTYSSTLAFSDNIVKNHTSGSGIVVLQGCDLTTIEGIAWPRVDQSNSSETTNTYQNNLPLDVDFYD